MLQTNAESLAAARQGFERDNLQTLFCSSAEDVAGINISLGIRLAINYILQITRKNCKNEPTITQEIKIFMIIYEI